MENAFQDSTRGSGDSWRKGDVIEVCGKGILLFRFRDIVCFSFAMFGFCRLTSAIFFKTETSKTEDSVSL